MYSFRTFLTEKVALPYLYHGTSSRHLASIKNSGLRVSGIKDERNSGVFFTTEPEIARREAAATVLGRDVNNDNEDMESVGGERIILVFDRRKLKGLQRDDSYSADSPRGQHSYYVEHDVPWAAVMDVIRFKGKKPADGKFQKYVALSHRQATGVEPETDFSARPDVQALLKVVSLYCHFEDSFPMHDTDKNVFQFSMGTWQRESSRAQERQRAHHILTDPVGYRSSVAWAEKILAKRVQPDNPPPTFKVGEIRITTLNPLVWQILLYEDDFQETAWNLTRKRTDQDNVTAGRAKYNWAEPVKDVKPQIQHGRGLQSLSATLAQLKPRKGNYLRDNERDLNASANSPYTTGWVKSKS